MNKEYKIEDIACSCVYLLKKNGNVVYVGKTKNGFKRIMSHYKKKDFDTVEIREVENDRLNEVEANLILDFKPKYNMTMPNSFSVKKLREKIKEDIGFNIYAIDIKRICKHLDIELEHFNGLTYVRDYNYNKIVEECLSKIKELDINKKHNSCLEKRITYECL